MLTKIRRLPTPALVISVIALVVAVGGGAFAIASGDKQQDKKIAKKAIKKAAPGLSVKHASTADIATAAGTAGTANNAYTGFNDTGVSMPGTLTATGNPIATLNVAQAGHYVITASLVADETDSATSTVQCKLAAGSNNDTVDVIVPGSSGAHEQSMTLQTTHTFNAPGTVTLACTDSNALNTNISAFSIRMSAVQVASLTNAHL